MDGWMDGYMMMMMKDYSRGGDEPVVKMRMLICEACDARSLSAAARLPLFWYCCERQAAHIQQRNSYNSRVWVIEVENPCILASKEKKNITNTV